MVSYAATLDVPRHVVEFLARLLAAHRRRIGTPKGSRALGPFRQAVLVLRWFRDRGCLHCLALTPVSLRPPATATYMRVSMSWPTALPTCTRFSATAMTREPATWSSTGS